MKIFNKVRGIAILLFALVFVAPCLSQVIPSESGYIPSSNEYWMSVPTMTLNPQSANLILPVEVDNSQKKFFPQFDGTETLYIYNQGHNTAACQNVSTVFYTFAYEMNRLRNRNGNTQSSRYAPNFSYNHLNHGHRGWQGYTSLEKVQKFLTETGAMSDSLFDGPGKLNHLDNWKWHTGFDYYKHVFTNKLLHVQKFDMTVQTGLQEETLELMKHYLYDHNEGTPDNGGLISIGVINQNSFGYLPQQSPYAGQFVVTKFVYDDGGHAMAIVGYNDEVKFDWGGAGTSTNFLPDGEFRNDIDNNKDGVIDVRDWEIGAFKVVDSYDTTYFNKGFKWMLYSYFPHIQNQWFKNEMYALQPKMNNEPSLVFKAKINAGDRDDFRLGCGYAPLANATAPVGDPIYFTGYDFDGGSLPMQGLTIDSLPLPDTIDVLFDLSVHFDNQHIGKAYFLSEAHPDSIVNGTGNIEYLALVDYRWNEEFELPFEGTMPYTIGSPVAAGIEYDLITEGPQAPPITTNTIFTANKVARFTPLVNNNATLTLNDGVRVDMYNSTITIEAGSHLVLGNNVIIRGRKGINKLVINGFVQTGNHVSFIAEQGATLEVVYNNPLVTNTLSHCIFFNADLTVQAGIIYIEQTQLSFNASNNVTIHPYGRLMLDSCLLTKSGTSLWKGIQVLGTPNQQQVSPFTYQGYLGVINGTIIEYAEIGVSVGIDGQPLTYGGILKANNVIFRNNLISVAVLPYTYANLTTLQECAFVLDAILPGGRYPQYMVVFNQVTTPWVKACSFLNNVTAYTSVVGVASNCGLVCSGVCDNPSANPCPSYTYAKFENLYRGVNIYGQAGSTVDISHTWFKNNRRGLYLSGLTASTIVQNIFELPSAYITNDTVYGCYLDHCTGYLVTENTFSYTGSNNARTVGLYVKHSNLNAATASNEIYNNTFGGLYCGSIAYGRNRYSTTAGLCYKCNDFSGSNHDIVALKNETGTPGNNTGIAASQGQKNALLGTPDPTLPTGNTFSNFTAHVYDLNNNAKPFTYVHHNSNIQDYKVIPDHYTTTTVSLNRDTRVEYDKTLACPSKLNNSGGGSEEDDKAEADHAKAEADSLTQALAQLVDGGSTEALTEEVTTSIPSEGLATRVALLAESPYLTDTVMKAAIAKEEVLPNAMVRDVLVANPQSAKEPELLEALDNRTEPLSDAMLGEIMQNATVFGAREVAERNISHANYRASLLQAKVIRAYANDTLHPWAADSLTAYLGGMQTPDAEYDLAMRHALKGEQTIASQHLAIAGQLAGTTPEATVLYQRCSQLTNLAIALYGTSMVPDSLQTAQLFTLAEGAEDLPGVYARNLLKAANLTDYNETVVFPDPEGLKMTRAHKVILDGKTVSRSEYLTLQPNPASDYVVASYRVTAGHSASLILSDATGKQLEVISIKPETNQKIITFARLTGGHYLITLVIDGKNVETGVISVVK